MLIAAISISVATSAGNCEPINAYYSPYSYEEYSYYGEYIHSKDCGGGIARYYKNPYYKSQSCSPDNSWTTCYEFVFEFRGVYYYFNKQQ